MAPRSLLFAKAGGAVLVPLLLAAADPIFERFDSDRNGQIGWDEWGAAHAAMAKGARGASAESLDALIQNAAAPKLFALWDLDGDKSLSRPEWEAAFALMDADHDGTVIAGELAAEVVRAVEQSPL